MMTESFRKTFEIAWDNRNWNDKELKSITDCEKAYQPLEVQNV